MWLVRCLHTVYPRRSHQFSGRNSADECPFSECPISSTFFKAGHSVYQQMSSESFTYFTMLLHTHFCICLSLSSFYLLSKIWLSSFSLIFNLLYIVPLSVCLSCFYPDVLTRSGDCWHRHSLCTGACDVSESTQQAKAFKQRYDFGQVSKAETFEQFISPLRRSP